MENQNATRPTVWELSEGFNDPLRWIHDSQKALGTLYDHVRHELAGGTIGVVQDILAHAERDLLALQEKIATTARAQRAESDAAPANYGILQERIATLEAVAAQPGLDRAYRLACDLGNSLDTIRDVRHSLVALSMVDGLEDWQRGAVDLAFRSLDRELEAIDDLTDPIAIDWRKANGLKPEGGLPDGASEQEDA